MSKCSDRLQKIGGDVFSEDEIEKILADAKDKLAQREGLAASSEDALRKAISESQDELTQKVKSQSLLLAEEELQVARNADNFKGFRKLKRSPLKVFVRALTIGTKLQVAGSKARNLATYIPQLKGEQRVVLLNLIDSILGSRELLKGGQHDVEFLDAMNGKETNNEIANKFGKAYREMNDKRLEKLTIHGIRVDKLVDRGIKQSHDPELLLRTADSFYARRKIMFANLGKIDQAGLKKEISFQRWFKIIDPLLDNIETFGEGISKDDISRENIQRDIYDNIVSEATNNGASTEQDVYNTSRFYHFKDSASQLAYSKEYGVGGLLDSLISEADGFGKAYATLELQGNNPLKTIRKTVNLVNVQNPGRFKKSDILSAIKEGEITMRQARGASDSVYGLGGQLVKAVGLALTLKVAPTLPALVVINDIAPAILEISRLGGDGIFKSSIKFFNTTQKLLRNTTDMNNFVEHMELRRDMTEGSVDKFAGVRSKELRGKFIRLAMKLSPHEFMNHLEKITAAHELTLQLGQNRNVAFDDLPHNMGKILNLYGIDNDTWDLMRKGSIEIGGRHHITTDAVRNLNRDEVKNFLRTRRGVKRVTETRIDRELSRVQQLYTSMVGDRMDIASNAVGAQQRAFWDLRFDKTNAKGRIFSNIFTLPGMLRMYETAILQRTLWPIIYGGGAESLGEALFRGKMEWTVAARWIGISTVLGIIGGTLRSLMSGEIPDKNRILTEAIESPIGLLGRGVEISKRPGKTALEALLGPGVTMPSRAIGDVYDTIRNIFSRNDPSRNAIDFLTQAIPPFNNAIARNAIHHMVQNQYGNMNRG